MASSEQEASWGKYLEGSAQGPGTALSGVLSKTYQEVFFPRHLSISVLEPIKLTIKTNHPQPRSEIQAILELRELGN